jgi:PTS system sucrose-specific IIC component
LNKSDVTSGDDIVALTKPTLEATPVATA